MFKCIQNKYEAIAPSPSKCLKRKKQGYCWEFFAKMSGLAVAGIMLISPVQAYTEYTPVCVYAGAKPTDRTCISDIETIEQTAFTVTKLTVDKGYKVSLRRYEYKQGFDGIEEELVEARTWTKGTYYPSKNDSTRDFKRVYTVTRDDAFDADSQVCFYKYKSATGQRFCSAEDVWFLSTFNDVAQSITFPPGLAAKLYRHSNYQGTEVLVRGDQDLGVLAKQVSSMKILKSLETFDLTKAYHLVPNKDHTLLSRFGIESVYATRHRKDTAKIGLLKERRPSQQWKIFRSHADGTLTWQDQNGQNLCLISPSDVDLVSLPDSPQCRWQVETVGDNLFRFKNKYYKQYLTMVDGQAVELRSVAEDAGLWKLKLADEVEYDDSYQRKQARISTNPDSPLVPVDKRNTDFGTANDYQTNIFDWRVIKWSYVGYVGSSNPTEQVPLRSPFYQNALERYPFSAPENSQDKLPNMQPESGWELVKHNLGYHMLKGGQANVPFTQKTYGLPYVMLYNRYTGKLRVVALYDHSPGTFNTAAIELSHNDRNGRVASNLFAPYGSAPLNRTAGSTKVTAMVALIAIEEKQWIYADFDLGYDPCTSCFESVLTVKISPVQNGETSLTGRFSGNSVPVRDSNGFVDSNYLTSYFNDSGLDTQVGASSFKSYQALYHEFKYQSDYATAVYNEKNWSSSDPSAIALKKAGEALDVLASTSPEPISKAALSTLSSIFGFANFSAQTKVIGFKLPPPMPSVLVGEMALRGVTSVLGNSDSVHIVTPGSLNAEQALESSSFSSNGVYPTYNEELGVFAMVTVPSIGVKASVGKVPYKNGTVVDASWGKISDDGFSCYHTRTKYIRYGCLPTKITGDLYYTLNPNTDLHPSELDVFVAIETLVNGRHERITETVPIEKWRELTDIEILANGVTYNLKVIVVKAGLVETDLERMLEGGDNKGELFYSYTYPLKLKQGWVAQEVDTSLTIREQFASLITPLEHHEVGTPSGVSTPYPLKPFYVAPDELKDSFCMDGGYKTHLTSLVGN